LEFGEKLLMQRESQPQTQPTLHPCFSKTEDAARSSENALYRMMTNVEQIGPYMRNQMLTTNAELKI